MNRRLQRLLSLLWRTREGQRMVDGWCTGNWSDIFNWVHPRCREIGLPHPAHSVDTREK